jgi:hypothetical protein
MLEPTVEVIPLALNGHAYVISRVQCPHVRAETYQQTGVLINDRQYDVLDLDGTDVGQTLQYRITSEVSLI